MQHDVQWVTAAPTWNRRPAHTGAFVEPAILEFARDDFIDVLRRHLGPPPNPDGSPAPPGDLSDYTLAWSSHRAPPAGADDDWRPQPPADGVPKLFHPAHGRHYLVVASLVCRIPGLPDRRVDTARGERVACVIRRVRAGREQAWIPEQTPDTGAWQDLAEPAALDPREELRPMFPVAHRRDGRPRRLWAALIPVATRETYRVAPSLAAPSPGDDALLAGPRAVIRQGIASLRAAEPYHGHGAAGVLQQAWFILLELAALLSRHLPATYDDLSLLPAFPPTLAGPMRGLWDLRAVADGETDEFPPALDDTVVGALIGIDADRLDLQILAQLRQLDPPPAADGDAAVPRFDDPDDQPSQFLIRCVYRRHACNPGHPPVVSAPTRRFTLASFFDSDAPGRTIRIPLPTDVSALGLRKQRRNVAFLLSPALRDRLARIGPLKDLLDGNLASGGGNTVGELCSLSIPIITICAYIVLSIFLSLLNIVFWWLAFVRVCIPIPRRSAS